MTSNRRLLLPFLLPYLVYVGLAALADGLFAREVDYAIRILLTGGALAWAWRSYLPLRGSLASVAWGVGAGLAGLAIWVFSMRPLVAGEAQPWSDAAFVLRLAAAGLLVPVFEEQLMRGYVLRFVHQWVHARRQGAADPFGEVFERQSILDVAPGAAGRWAVLLSSLAFALGHAPVEMPAALLYGLLMAALLILRKGLLACVVAHATTNIALAFYVRLSGEWGLW